MKKLLICTALLLAICANAIAGGYVTVKNVSPASWTVKTSRTVKKDHSAAKVGGAAVGWWALGPIGAAGGYVISKLATGDDEDRTEGSSETMHGYHVRLSNGETIRTLTQYHKGQRILREDIEEN